MDNLQDNFSQVGYTVRSYDKIFNVVSVLETFLVLKANFWVSILVLVEIPIYYYSGKGLK